MMPSASVEVPVHEGRDRVSCAVVALKIDKARVSVGMGGGVVMLRGVAAGGPVVIWSERGGAEGLGRGWGAAGTPSLAAASTSAASAAAASLAGAAAVAALHALFSRHALAPLAKIAGEIALMRRL
jgi:hypothetical protein